jgi:hypothetical protein
MLLLLIALWTLASVINKPPRKQSEQDVRVSYAIQLSQDGLGEISVKDSNNIRSMGVKVDTKDNAMIYDNGEYSYRV